METDVASLTLSLRPVVISVIGSYVLLDSDGEASIARQAVYSEVSLQRLSILRRLSPQD